MIKEHDCVILGVDLPAERLRAGDLGTVVHIHGKHEGYEVEFVALDGKTVAVVTLLPSQLRPIGVNQMANVRNLSTA